MLKPNYVPVPNPWPAVDLKLPAFFRGVFTIPTGGLGDTFVTMLGGWGKGQVWVNGHNVARYWGIGPQFSFYCPSGWLVEGQNDVVAFETNGLPAGVVNGTLTVELKAAHTITGQSAKEAKSNGWF